MNYRPISFTNLGYFDLEFTNKELQPIVDEVNEIKENNFNAQSMNNVLAGNICKEYTLTKSHKHIEKLLMPSCVEYDKHYNYMRFINVLTKDGPLVLDKSWVNFQEKYEFNPPHVHSGIFSFVIWIEIPYSMEEEKNQPRSKNSTNNCPGHFNFQYINALGHIMDFNLPTDYKYVGKGVLFPSGFTHGVYPFYTSDDYRISVSGNFKIQNMLGIKDLYSLK